ncbi:WD40 repeat-like-containing domain protein [Cordyceps fumosorosea ARSEF 2679]|uniref:WD40 repeat-like-containing domain protein n=1 Tax=Cordyceps fumosorosea (strain ARSEF 2679) TaxID=1081104 RepID=A0A167PBK6_CORFA|nr:WD40 repeat-like-containing domain protein [Cordyceps fumosorosea ARSEF 2679]OAA56488.1 WD40 repeat-like-containing domain protein [Cordyceps fumosorosea ARSEF 2679]
MSQKSPTKPFDWAAVQREIFSAAGTQPPAEPSSPRRHSGAHPGPHDQRTRSLSLSLPWRRPRSSLFVHDTHNLNENAIDDSNDQYPNPQHRRHATAGPFRGIIRRASHSFKGMVHRRPSLLNEEPIHEQQDHPESRPSTASSTWNKLRQATTFRQARSAYGLDACLQASLSCHHPTPASLPIPALGDAPPFIPEYGGAAAKASAAMQNDFFARNRWLHQPTSDDGNDRESGIGIVLTGTSAEFDIDGEAAASETTKIRRVDFITALPTELAIQILANLDAATLATMSTVSRKWADVIENQHVWRESFFREMGQTFATGGPVQPGTGLGIPHAVPENDWKRAYRTRQQLAQHWAEGRARPVYLCGHTDSVYCLQFDEHKIVSGSRDKTIRIWDMRTLECRLVIGPPDVVHARELLFDDELGGAETHYASGPNHGDERMVASTPAAVAYSMHHMASILCLQYDDEILVTGSSDATAIIHSVRDGYRPVRRLEHHTAAVLDLVFDDRHIVTCSKDTTICVWDRATGNLLRQLRGHAGPVNAVQMRGRTVVSCSGDLLVKLWDLDSGRAVRQFAGHTKGLACSQFSDDGRLVASAGNDRAIRVWDARTGDCVHELPNAHANLVRSLHVDSVSGRLVSASYDTDIKVWDLRDGRQLLEFPRWHASWVLSAKSDYRRIVSTGQAPKILIMDFGAGIDGIEMLEGAPSPPFSSSGGSGFF